MRRLGPSYNRLLSAYTISNVGNGVLIGALPLLAAKSTRNPLAISGLMVAAGIPWLLIGPLSGAIVDRFERRIVMVVAEAGRAAVMGAATVYVLMGGNSIVAFYALLVVIGIGETFFDPAGLALVPGLVAPAQLDAANSRLFGAQTLAQRFVGPPLAGWLFAFTAWAPLGIDAVSFLVTALVMLGLPRGSPPTGWERPFAGLLTETVEGFRWVWRDSVLRAFIVGSGALHFATAAGLSVFVLIAQDRYKLAGLGFGLMLSAYALGYFLGYLIAPSVAAKYARARICVVALLGAAIGLSLVGLTTLPPIGGLGLALTGFSSAQVDVVSISYRQAAVPNRILGRVLACFLFVVHGAVPVGAVVGGLVASWVGIRYTYLASALSAAAVAPVLWFALKGAELDPGKIRQEPLDP